MKQKICNLISAPLLSFQYIQGPESCKTLQEVIGTFDGSFESFSDDLKFQYSLPTTSSFEIESFFAHFAQIYFSAEFVAKLPNGRVFSSGVVISPDGTSIARDVSIDFGQPFEKHWLLQRNKIPKPTLVRGQTVVIATANGNSYYHWLFDELPRLLSIGNTHVDAIIANNSSQFSREAFRLSNFSGKILPATNYTHYQCENLIIPSLIGSTGHPTPRLVNLIEEFVNPLYRKKKIFEKIYISRQKASRRRVTNEHELWDKLKELGFKKLFLEKMTWSEQVLVFYNAKIIVAPHGAGLANIIFSCPGTKVVEFFHRTYMHWCFWQLASVKKLDYRPVVSLSQEPLSHTNGHGGLDIKANISEILKAISE